MKTFILKCAKRLLEFAVTWQSEGGKATDNYPDKKLVWEIRQFVKELEKK